MVTRMRPGIRICAARPGQPDSTLCANRTQPNRYALREITYSHRMRE